MVHERTGLILRPRVHAVGAHVILDPAPEQLCWIQLRRGHGQEGELEESVRIISARTMTPRERRAYEREAGD